MEKIDNYLTRPLFEKPHERVGLFSDEDYRDEDITMLPEIKRDNYLRRPVFEEPHQQLGPFFSDEDVTMPQIKKNDFVEDIDDYLRRPAKKNDFVKEIDNYLRRPAFEKPHEQLGIFSDQDITMSEIKKNDFVESTSGIKKRRKFRSLGLSLIHI